jgi:NitT/TauT family transport system ATP-binding protein
VIRLEDVHKTFASPAGRLRVLEGASLDVGPGEFVALVGPSGCGKTTLLQLIAGLTAPDSGRITVAGEQVAAPRSDTGLVFQDLSLFPWLRVHENIGFGLRLRGIPPLERTEIVRAYEDAFGLAGFGDYFPQEISGGMQQRVALARTLITEPSILLLDEPFGSLDATTRAEMHDFLQVVEQGKTTVLVTHDIKEAAYLADRVLVLSRPPASIAAAVDVRLPVPRTPEMTYDRYFVELLRQLEEIAREGWQRPR